MKIIICSSISAADKVFEVKKKLKNKGHIVEIPQGIKNEYLRGRTQVSISEKAEDKIKYDVLKIYFEKIKQSDAVLVVNPDKNGIAGYIGGNTLIEMAFGHVLDKKIYCLYPVADLPYTPEILAMKPTILDGDLSLLK